VIVLRDASIAVAALLIGLAVGVAVMRPANNITRRLDELLRAPQPRGRFGEVVLEAILGLTLPAGTWQRHHAFGSGEIVDVVIQLPTGVIPVDVKFPTKSFDALCEATSAGERLRRRMAFLHAARRYIDEIAEKYIHPNEGTVNFALCFLPGEDLLHELLRSEGARGRRDVFTYGLEKHVLLVSPSTLFAHLAVVNFGLRGLRVEAGARRLTGAVAELEHELEGFRADYAVLHDHLRNASNRSAELRGRLDELPRRLTKVMEALPLGGSPPHPTGP
jgi:DNA recombination protein RmuC